MIIFNLRCGDGHNFEGWFASTEAFEDQATRGQVRCPICDRQDVVRLPSAPRVRRAVVEPPRADGAAAMVPRLKALLDAATAALADAEDVGERFPEEARRIHYEEAPGRSIRGQASIRDALDLIDEGIVVMPVPGPDKKTSH